MRIIIAFIMLSLCAATFAQNYHQWDEDKLREELGRLADITRKIAAKPAQNVKKRG